MKSFGGTPQGARLERMKASPRWAGERFRNVHPILPGLRVGVQLVIPRLGEVVEPAHAAKVEPWWRSVEVSGAPQETALPKSMPWPID